MLTNNVAVHINSNDVYYRPPTHEYQIRV